MKIMNIDNYEGLFEIVRNCKGQVHLISKEGDDIVLTSKLSRFFLEALKNSDNDLIDELELVCDDPSDTIKFVEFLVRG